ncbi:hypothetical protein [Rubellimicrobium aerolatum]|uniref:Uncharacterized protein n=1 Tax=Rubellimicrobium aerolatum TaxID=490979 RepID=A0ABW0SFV4_9RHOB|nr:hypothetical protein [Rubellimicrobium aerolatum]MBP1806417.1 hypothetical protein [Rubellimicrobium aerolatum]
MLDPIVNFFAKLLDLVAPTPRESDYLAIPIRRDDRRDASRR